MNLEISEVANLPTKHGTFKIQAFKEHHKEHLVIFTEKLPDIPIVRVHSECLTGDALGSLKCDCGDQLDVSLKMIAKEGGMVLYLRQDRGFDTVAANHQLGFPADARSYEIVHDILKHFKINRIRLLTNNPEKIKSLQAIEIVERLPIIVKTNAHNQGYLQVKKEQMGHLL
jgi:GTP cyclohydrolase II